MKKAILFIAGFLLIPVLSTAAVKYHDSVTGKDILVLNCDSLGNQIVIPSGLGIGMTESVLTPYTSGAFTVYASIYDSDTSSATFQVNASSINVKISSGNVSGLFTQLEWTWDMTNVLTDTYIELVSSINAQPYLTCTLVNGCYYLGLATGTTNDDTPRTDDEGNVDGLQYDAKGKQVDILYSTNVVTIYQNATDTLSKYFTTSDYYGVTQIASTSTVNTTLMYIYESTSAISADVTNTLLNIPVYDYLETYPENSPIRTSSQGNDLDFRVVYSTWCGEGDYTLIHIIKQ